MSTASQRNPWVAVRPGEDVARLARRVSLAHSVFLEGEVRPGGPLRPVVLDSWRRSQGRGVDPDGLGRVAVADSELRQYRAAQPIASILPVVRKLLVEDAVDAGLLVAISDAHGRLLWVEGDTKVKDRAHGMGFVEGADWSEDRVGTNAPGTALALDHHIQIFGAEHFSRMVHDWSCSAAPVHDPLSGQIIGAVDITGGPRVAAPEALSLIRATVVAAESELRLRLLDAPRVRPERLRLRVLGSVRPTLERGEERIRLSQRHAEILVLLAAHPEGLSADHLALLLDDGDLDPVTVRAELSRLRKTLGGNAIGSKPYRLLADLDSDVDEVRHALDRGDPAAALRAYSGPLLPRSLAPGIAEIRAGLRGRMRAALLRSGEWRLLARWTESADGCDDLAAWAAYRDALDPRSSLYAQVREQLRLLDKRLGV
ncbi:GAF domain-containing protein [Nocardia sp. JMUB6875]|uniref:transcriptional regulator n=1 Tax=Nocardia sp. JMUB6875 TaxID=3158170 RepID=UPI0032E7E3A7